MNIFASAFARALSRQPPSAHLICRFTSSLSAAEKEDDVVGELVLEPGRTVYRTVARAGTDRPMGRTRDGTYEVAGPRGKDVGQAMRRDSGVLDNGRDSIDSQRSSGLRTEWEPDRPSSSRAKMSPSDRPTPPEYQLKDSNAGDTHVTSDKLPSWMPIPTRRTSSNRKVFSFAYLDRTLQAVSKKVQSGFLQEFIPAAEQQQPPAKQEEPVKEETVDAEASPPPDDPRPFKSSARQLPRSGFHEPHVQLLRTLHRQGNAADIPEGPPSWKADLSKVDPFFRKGKEDLMTSAGALLRSDPAVNPSPSKKRYTGQKKSLKEITGRVVKVWQPGQLQEVQSILDAEDMAYLTANDLSVTDVVRWAWVLKAQDTRQSGKRLQSIRDRVKVRPFLVLMLLRGRYLDRETLRFLLPHVERLLDPKTEYGVRDHKTAVVLFVRLLRKAREIWPLILPRITNMISTYDFASTSHGATPSAWVTLVYNRLLSLLSIPPVGAPFRHVVTLRDCQFTLIQRMAERGHPVTREGYRAIIRVHLALPKSESEKTIVRRMVASWPPWEVEKNGLEALQRQLQDVPKSRASELLTQMVIAGYDHKSWEKEASVLAGRDIDGTPTVQTRSFLRRKQALRRLDIWASRIRATRTIDEAWWNFLNYRREWPGRTSIRIYEEMFLKLSQSNRLHELETRKAVARDMVQQLQPAAHKVHGFTRRDIWLRHLEEQALRNVAGDGTEVYNPTDEWHAIKPSSPPPTIEELWEMLVADHVRPTTQLTTLLLKEAKSMDFAGRVLMQWDAMTAISFITPLESSPPVPPVPLNKITDIPTFPVFTAYLQALAKQGHIDDAIRLLRFHGTPYAPAWMLAMGWKVKPKLFGKMTVRERAAVLQEIWQLFEEAKELVEVENEMCRVLAIAVEKWVTGLSENVQREWVECWGAPVERLVETCWDVWNIRTDGDESSSPSSSFSSVESTLAVDPASDEASSQQPHENNDDLPPQLIPSSVHLHHLIRALGFSGRYTHIATLLRHLAQNNTALTGHMGTRVLIASRVFLEGATLRSNGFSGPLSGEGEEVGRKVLKEMDELVRREWGGWGGGGGRLGDGEWRVGAEGMNEMEVELEMVRYLQLGGLRRGPWADREGRVLPLLGGLEGVL